MHWTNGLGSWLSVVSGGRRLRKPRRQTPSVLAAVAQPLESRLLLVSQLGNSALATNSSTLTFTVDAGPDRLLVVSAGDANSIDITSVTFGGVALTQQVQGDDRDACGEIWTLALGSSTVSTSGTIQVTSDVDGPTFISAFVYQGVDQSAPVTATGITSGNWPNAFTTVTLASDTEDFVHDLLYTWDVTTATLAGPGPTQTTVQDAFNLAGSGRFNNYRISQSPGASPTQTVSWATNDLGHVHTVINMNGLAEDVKVNTYTTNSQQTPAIAMDADGDYVIVWASSGQDGSSYGVYAQRYNAAGAAQGGEFRVNSYTTNGQVSPAVAMDADGDFVVVWSSTSQDGSSYGVYAQRYNAAGVAQGGEFRVNTYTTGLQRFPTVAMDVDGDFVVAWESTNQDGSGDGLYAQRYDASGVAQGSEFRVNTYTTGSQRSAVAEMDADGDFVVAWTSFGQEGNDDGVYAQRYNAAGVAQGSEFRVNTYTTSNQVSPTIAMDLDGDFVIAWQSYSQDGSDDGVYAQRYNATGAAQGSEFRVNTYTTNIQVSPTIAMDFDGDFVIAWQSYSQDGSDNGVYAQRYNAGGAAQGSEFRVNTYTGNAQVRAAVAVDADGDFVIAWGSNGQDGSNGGIYSQQYTEFGSDNAGPIVSDVLVNNATLLSNGRLASRPSSMTVAFSEDLNITGGTSGTNSVLNISNWTLTRNGVDITVGTVTGITFGLNVATGKYEAVLTFASPLSDGDYVLSALSSIQDLAGNGLDGDANGTPGGDFSRSFRVLPALAVGNEFRVNTYTFSNQVTAVMAMDADGDFVVVWRSLGQDGDDYGIYAQRYNAAAVAQGTEFRVNTYTVGGQQNPTVAMDADGHFVIAWDSFAQDGSSNGVYAQRYNSAGVTQGSEFRVNTYTTNNQRNPAVAMDINGDFVVAWQSSGQDGSDFGIYAQRYNSAGIAQGSEFRINTYTTSTQRNPSIALDADGDFVVTWQSIDQDGSGDGVYAQRYNSLGVAQGSEFRVNLYTTGNQAAATVALDADGDFVIVWQSNGQDGDLSGIFAQRYNFAGTAQGSQFRVNSYTTGTQNNSTLAIDTDGDFVVVWQSLAQDGSDYGVYAQRYNSAGITQGSEFRVNTYTTIIQQLGTVAMDADGDFVAAWQTIGQDGSGYGIYAQRYGINRVPTAFNGNLVTNEDTPLNGFLLWGSDAETAIGNLTFNISTPPAKGTLIRTGARRFNFIPSANADGADSFQFTVSDGVSTSAPATVNITINPVNDLPTASTGLTMITDEDTPVIGYALWGFDLETPLSSLVFNISTAPTKGTLIKTGQRTFNYIPGANANGADSFQFTVTDSNGAVSAPATVNITINPVNDLPTASTGLTMITDEDTPVIGYALWGFDVETPLSSLVFNISTAPTKGTLIKTGQRTFNYIPGANANGADSFQFTVTDSNGVVSAPATVSITINPVNDLPEAYGLNLSTNRNTPLNGVLLWGFDVETSIGSLVFNIPTTSNNGTLIKTGQRSFSYTPNNNFTGNDSFQFTVTDNNGVTSPAATVNITVNAPPPDQGPQTSTPATADPYAAFAFSLITDDDGSLGASTNAVPAAAVPLSRLQSTAPSTSSVPVPVGDSTSWLRRWLSRRDARSERT
jgi:hypothetical protein